MPRMFGTDGVRGLANRDLTAQLALDLGDAVVRVLGDKSAAASAVSTSSAEEDTSLVNGSHSTHARRRALIGRDTRVSGDFLASALAAGMSAGGFDVIDAGIIPTPGVAFLTSVLNVEMGAVISASHNPMPDNGIKFFARGGFKLPDSKEDEIEAVLGQDWERPTGAGVGRVSHDTTTATNLYIDHLVSAVAPLSNGSTTRPKPLAGLRVVADCANGATSVVAPEALRRAGAEVIVINASPDGYNINDHAGSTHPEQLQAMVKASKADLGVAFDGDADRCLAVDENGNMVNGDQIMGILARAKQAEGKLNHDTLVVTVMSNLGLKLALKDMGIATVQTNVGDRYVLEEMLKHDYSLGGEQSGHVINREFATTGDGTLTALTLCREVVRSGKKLSQMAADFPQLPQALVNVPNVDKMASKTNAAVLAAVEKESKLLGDTGRVLLRPSGTEPLVRVMCEAATQTQADEVCARLAQVVVDNLKL
ncbi:phosphoglucosamine mutase [Gardnerella sp. KA00603]|uniref:phosphoglucosamine mutase n=1 Tax=Gardnerella sp. KA00603 TaxID=2749076 RepID=UPI003BA84A8D